MKKQIMELHKSNSSDRWLVRHLDVTGAPNKSVNKLFGTHVLPTPYANSMPAHKMLSILKLANPDCVVRLA